LIDKILKKNRRILLRMINSGRKKVGARELYLEGFNFDFTTHSIKDPVNKSCKFCYEVGYLEHLDGTVSIVVEEFGALSKVKR
jgi:hypothetical protein